jgi:hypothetical protein
MQIEQAKAQAQVMMKQEELKASVQAEAQKVQGQVMHEASQLEADMQTKDKDRENALVLDARKQELEVFKIEQENRQKDLDRAQQMNIELLKLQAQKDSQAEQFAHDGETKKGDNDAKRDIAGAPKNLEERLAKIEKMASATRVKTPERDPKTNRIIRVVETLQ